MTTPTSICYTLRTARTKNKTPSNKRIKTKRICSEETVLAYESVESVPREEKSKSIRWEGFVVNIKPGVKECGRGRGVSRSAITDHAATTHCNDVTASSEPSASLQQVLDRSYGVISHCRRASPLAVDSTRPAKMPQGHIAPYRLRLTRSLCANAYYSVTHFVKTRSSIVAEKPRDALRKIVVTQ